MSNERNPVLLPAAAPKKNGCPKCHHPEWDSRRVQDVITYKCRNKECKNKWQGIATPVPTPILPQDPTPPLVQHHNIYTKEGAFVGTVEELRRPSNVQQFRKGAIVPDGEDS